ncbi:MAG: glycosyltransferase family 87 protein [Candidatus Bathyarchaeia archaeon]|jgi:hypothetical protein
MTNKTTLILIAATAILITLNATTAIAAYPETYTPSPGITTDGDILAKDFSAYYVGAYRLWNTPAQIYSLGALGGNEPLTPPHPQAYKYLPNFLLITTPFLALPYQQALWAFDIIQFAFLPLMAYFIYKLLDGKHPAVIFAVLVVALLLPFPTQWGPFSCYYWQWGEGQAKVFLTFLLLLSFYFGKQNKPVLSGLAFAFGFFDPRFGLLAIPLYVMYNRRNLKPALLSALGFLGLTNIMLLYPGMGSAFLHMVFDAGLMTPLYYYALIPLLTLLALMAVNFKELVAAFDYKGVFAGFTGALRSKSNGESVPTPTVRVTPDRRERGL